MESETPPVTSVHLVTLKSTGHVVPRKTLIPWQPVSQLNEENILSPRVRSWAVCIQVCPACLSELYRDTPEFKG